MGVRNNQPRRINLTNKELVALRKLIRKEIYKHENPSVLNLSQELQEVYNVLKNEVRTRGQEGTLFDKEA